MTATKESVLTYLADRKAEGRSPSSLFQTTIALRHHHRFLVREGLAAVDAMAGIKLPRLQSRLPQPLTQQEVDRLLAAPAGGRYKIHRNLSRRPGGPVPGGLRAAIPGLEGRGDDAGQHRAAAR